MNLTIFQGGKSLGRGYLHRYDRLMKKAGDVTRICLWSGPRNVSTALMYAFSQRTDTTCLDEPLYGHYLKTSGAQHPAAVEVINAMNCDADQVIERQVLGRCPTPVLFCKQMAHHLTGFDERFLQRTVNVILTRDPREVLTTLVKQIPQPRLADTGYDKQLELLQRNPDLPVLDAKQLLLDPAGVLGQLMQRIGLRFDQAMLRWPAGPKPFDGVWAPHWYHQVHQSTGFAPYRPKSEPVPTEVLGLAEACEPLYRRLRAVAIEATG